LVQRKSSATYGCGEKGQPHHFVEELVDVLGFALLAAAVAEDHHELKLHGDERLLALALQILALFLQV
jgi:hypothetical protein